MLTVCALFSVQAPRKQEVATTDPAIQRESVRMTNLKTT